MNQHWIIVSFIFSLTAFLLGMLFNNIRFSHYGFDYFLFYDLSDYLKVTIHSAYFWMITFSSLLLVVVVIANFLLILAIILRKKRASKLDNFKNFLKLVLFLIGHSFILILVSKFFNYLTRVDFEWTTQGLSDLYQIKTRSEGDSFNCITLIDTNSNNLFIWDYKKEQIVVIPKANIATIRLLHDEMPSKGFELLSGGGNGGGREPQSDGTIPLLPSVQEEYNLKLTGWLESVRKVCPDRVDKTDVEIKMY